MAEVISVDKVVVTVDASSSMPVIIFQIKSSKSDLMSLSLLLSPAKLGVAISILQQIH